MKKQTTPNSYVKQLSEILFQRTQDWAEKEGLLKKKGTKSKYSPKALKFAEICNKANFGCQDQYVRDIVSELLGEQIPSKKVDKTSVNFILGIVVVPLSGANQGEPVLICQANGSGYAHTGSSPTVSNLTSLLRIATLVEIEYLMGILSERKEFESQVLQLILEKLGG